MIIIYHNPNSIHSNECLELLDVSKTSYEIIKYQDNTLDVIKLKKIIKLLNVSPIEIIRTHHALWIKKFQHIIDSGIQFTDQEYIEIMIENPVLIERPIIINKDKAVIGRPASKIFDIIS